MSRQIKRCIFCENPRTRKRGEHIWDDWINRESGVRIRRPSTVIELGEDGVLVRQYSANSLDIAQPVVCDPCNNTWMSDLTSQTKDRIEGFIRHDTPGTLNMEDIAIVRRGYSSRWPSSIGHKNPSAHHAYHAPFARNSGRRSPLVLPRLRFREACKYGSPSTAVNEPWKRERRSTN